MKHQYFQGMNKIALKKEIRELLSLYNMNQEFESVLLSGLILEKHYYCSKHNLRPLKFRKTYADVGTTYKFEAFFTTHGWHGISWRQCIEPRNKKVWISQLLRNAIAPISSKYKKEHLVCERCGKQASQEVDHVKPEFNEILLNALALIPDASLKNLLENMNWWSKQPFALPADNPALLYAIQVHQTAILQALCKKCHIEVTQLRKNLIK